MPSYRINDTTVADFPATTLVSDAAALQATFVPAAGMICCSLTHAGDELLDARGGLRNYAEHGATMGIPLLHPWANRLSGFQYSAADRTVRLDRQSPLLHRDGNGLPMHGIQPGCLRWRVLGAHAADDGARLSAQLDFTDPQLLSVFPFAHELQIAAHLRADTLTITTTLRPAGNDPVPVSFGYHPYLRLPNVARAEWFVHLPVRRRVVLDDRQIPTGAAEPVSIPPARLGARSFDAGFDALDQPARFVLAGGGRRVTLELVQGYAFAQIYAPAADAFICFEPMTAPTNALVAGSAPVVAPGASYTAVFTIRVERAV